MRKYILVLLLLAHFIGDAQSPMKMLVKKTNAGGAARANLSFESKFEGVSYSGTTIPVETGTAWDNQQHCSGCSYSVTAAPISRYGSGAVQFLLNKTDGEVSGSKRSEITGPSFSNGNEIWFGMSLYLKDYVEDDSEEGVLQFHQGEESVSINPIGLWVNGDKLTLVYTSDGIGVNQKYDDLITWAANTWYDVVMHIKFSNSSDGILEVWVNGVKKTLTKPDNSTSLIYTGPTGYSFGQYFKCGVYKWPWGETPQRGTIATSRTAYIDEVRFGNSSATYYDVMPGNY